MSHLLSDGLLLRPDHDSVGCRLDFEGNGSVWQSQSVQGGHEVVHLVEAGGLVIHLLTLLLVSGLSFPPKHERLSLLQSRPAD